MPVISCPQPNVIVRALSRGRAITKPIWMRAPSISVGLFFSCVLVNIFTTVCVLQVSRSFWIESLNEVKPVSIGLLKPDREVKLRFVDR